MPIHSANCCNGFTVPKSLQAKPWSLQRVTMSNMRACKTPVRRPTYPITDWMKVHSRQLSLAATEGKEQRPRMMYRPKESKPSRIDDSLHLQCQKKIV